MEDIEKTGWVHTQGDGYPTVAAFIAGDRDQETYVFRKFNSLTARNVLHLQGELIALEKRLDEMDREAARSTEFEVHAAMRSWPALERIAASGGKGGLRMKLMMDIELRLKKYHKALILQQSIAKLDSPDARVLTAFRNELHGAGETSPKLDAGEGRMLDNEADLIALKPPPDHDILSRAIRNHWPFPSRRSSSNGHASIEYFEERHLAWFVSALSTGIAAALLVGPILILYFITNLNARLGLVITFIALFALGLNLSTSATRDSVFAATAAYSAVLVVFVSGNLGNVNTNTPPYTSG